MPQKCQTTPDKIMIHTLAEFFKTRPEGFEDGTGRV